MRIKWNTANQYDLWIRYLEWWFFPTNDSFDDYMYAIYLQEHYDSEYERLYATTDLADVL